jgi:hypothetical protein
VEGLVRSSRRGAGAKALAWKHLLVLEASKAIG